MFEIMEPNVIVGYEITGAGDKCIDPDLRGIISDSGEIKWECYLPPGDSDLYFLRYCEDRFQVIGRKTESSDFYRDDDVKKWVFGLYGMKTFYPSGWQPLIGYETSSTKDTIKMTIPLQTADPKSEKHYKYPPTLIFTKGNSANAGISTGKQAKKRRSLFDTAVEQATDK